MLRAFVLLLSLSSLPVFAQAPGQATGARGTYRREARELERESRLRLSPAWTWVGLMGVATLGLVSVWSFVDTYEARRDYLSNPTAETYDVGIGRWRRSWGLAGTTAVLAVSTFFVALFGTDWSSASEEGRRVAFRPWWGGRGGGLDVATTWH